MKNLFVTEGLYDISEVFETLLEIPNVNGAIKIERIVSFGHPTPIGEWYDQEESEWVSLLSGLATLLYEDGTIVEMVAGDHILIPPHLRHRVEKVSNDAVWLTIFIS